MTGAATLTIWARNVAFSPDRRFVLTVSYDRTARLWDPTTGADLRSFVGQTQNTDVLFTPDSRSICTTQWDKAYLWDRNTGAEQLVITASGYIPSATLSQDGRYILMTVGSDVHLWDAASGKQLRLFTGLTRWTCIQVDRPVTVVVRHRRPGRRPTATAPSRRQRFHSALYGVLVKAQR